MMTLDAAREQLGFHCGADPRIHDPRWENGFLATLRPYSGLRLDVMANVDDCVRAVSEHLKEGQCLDRAIIGSLWAVVHYGRVWALDEGGMLKRNNLISTADAARLSDWLDDLSGRVMQLLGGATSDELGSKNRSTGQ
ncbi:MAG TPA: hypothetical protein VIY48_06295 [Candidatus Paceibacterota bacterium]